MIQARVVTDDSPTQEFTSGPGVSQLQCANDVSCLCCLLLKKLVQELFKYIEARETPIVLSIDCCMS